MNPTSVKGESESTYSPLFRVWRTHLACGGRLVYSEVVGGYGYVCESCGQEYAKRGYCMPFPKGVKSAGDVAKGIPLDQCLGKTFVLNSFLETSDPDDDIRSVLMYCKTEDNEDILLGTTSDVVRNQLKALDGKLPVLITPAKPGRYYTIY